MSEIMEFKDKLFSKILSKSDSYNFYKSNYDSNNGKNKEIKELNNKIKELNNEIKELKSQQAILLDKYENDIPVFDFDNMMSKFYISPVIKYPFSFHDKMCLASMDHIAKYIRNKLNQSNFNPLVSVVFPVYNYEENIKRIIDSVLNQSYDNFELIVIDDSSDDSTLDLIESIDCPKIKLISNNKKKGFAYCRNSALNAVNGEYIFYIDMDNLWDCEYLSSMLGLFLMLPDADAVYSGQYIYNKNFKSLLGVIFGSYNKSLLYNNNFISLSAFAHKKEVFEKITFDEKLDSLEDYFFLLNVAKFFKMYSAPILLSRFQSNSNSFHKIWGLNEELDIDQIKIIHKKMNNNIFKDFSINYPLNQKVSVVIPSFKLFDDLKECIEAILSFQSDFIDIIVVDNNSDDLIRKYLKTLSDEGKIKYIQNDVNYGFTYAIEQGIAVSDENSDILLLNNDAILTKGSLEAMQYYAYTLKNCGVIVPREVLYAGDERVNFHVPYANNNFECDVTPSKNHKNISRNPVFFDGNILELNFAPFFCTYIKRDVYNKTIGLDSEIGRHYVSDRLFCDFVRYILNLKVYHISDAIVYHKSQAATNKLREDNNKFDTMFIKNQWEPEIAEELGYRKYPWQE